MESTIKSWHIAKWPLLAWIETAVKGIALLVGIFTLLISFSKGIFTFQSDFRLLQYIIQGLLSIGLVAAIFDRIQEKEIIAMIFVILNNLAHWGILAAMTSLSPRNYFLIFWALILIGDLIKIIFLRIHNFQVRDTPPAAMYGLTAFYIVGYAVLIIFLIM